MIQPNPKAMNILLSAVCLFLEAIQMAPGPNDPLWKAAEELKNELLQRIN
tara:strand:+ start:62 stop:211 length:150 start_codon:yes stop_codon:yes gene_type:complete